MKWLIFVLTALVGMMYTLDATEKAIHLTLDDCLFVKCPVPEKGIVCSNYERALRLAKRLENSKMHKCSWGPFVVIGEYQGEAIFVGCASVGTGSGLFFTDLYVAGAKYVVRYGSDDVKAPPKSDAYLVKIVDEADNLYGYNRESGVDSQEWGKSMFASDQIVQALKQTAEKRGIEYEMRICHHLENYHGLRSPDKFSPDRSERLHAILNKLKLHPKTASFDMETAVLFRVAKDFNQHAATILQTVNKERDRVNSIEDIQAIEVENGIFFDYVLEALLQI